jgi:hypothetical protein
MWHQSHILYVAAVMYGLTLSLVRKVKSDKKLFGSQGNSSVGLVEQLN